jgi:hypothetical protein
MDAGEHDFLDWPGRMQVRQDFRNSPAAGRTTGNRRDAEGTAVIAAVLSLDEKASSPASPREGLALERLQVEIFRLDMEDLGDERVFFKVWDDPGDAGNCSSLSWLKRCPTAGGCDRLHSGSMDLADFLTGIGDSSSRDRAGVHDSKLGFRRVRDQDMSGCPELAGIGLCLRLIQAASDGVQVDLHGEYTTRLSKRISVPGVW